MSPVKMSKIESVMRQALAFYEAFNRHDIDGMMACMTDDCLLETHSPAPDGASHSGSDAVRQYWQDLFAASPQAVVDLEDIWGLGRRCVTRWRYAWVDADGTERHVRGIDVITVKDDAIHEMYSYVKG